MCDLLVDIRDQRDEYQFMIETQVSAKDHLLRKNSFNWFSDVNILNVS